MEETGHGLCLTERKSLTVTAVTEVVSFTDTEVVLHTALGTLFVQGRELQLKLLSLEGGRTEVAGQVTALIYEEPRQGGWLRRLMD